MFSLQSRILKDGREAIVAYKILFLKTIVLVGRILQTSVETGSGLPLQLPLGQVVDLPFNYKTQLFSQHYIFGLTQTVYIY